MFSSEARGTTWVRNDAALHLCSTIYGDGKQTRSFQFAADLIAGFIKLMNSETASYNTPVNLGNPDEYTILDFAKKIRARINPSIAIEHLPATKDDPKQRRPDITRAKAMLNWSPKVTVDEGLAYTIKYFAVGISGHSGWNS